MKRRALISYGLYASVTTLLGIRYAQSYLEPTDTLVRMRAESAAATDDSVLRFVVAGDVGTGARGQYAVARAIEQRRHLSPFSTALLTGDNIYENGEIEKVSQAFERPYANLLNNGVKFHAVLGNHDVRTQQGRDEVAYPGYNMAANYYSFIQQSVHFFALDTNQINSVGGRHRNTVWDTQLKWLRSQLKKSPAPWKIVFAHHPIYSSGYHGSSRDLARDLTPIFAEYGVQLYLNGHDHNYERTDAIDGTVYITSGNGAKLRRVGRSQWTAHASSQLGFTTFDVYDDRITVKAISTENTVYDEADIARKL